MKILSISDRVEPILYGHFDPAPFQGVELILSCGDLPPEYLAFLMTRLNAPLYYVKGNHDIRIDGYHPEGCRNIDSRLVVHEGLRILGLEGSHWYNGQPHQYTERQMAQKIRRLWFKLRRSKGMDIVVTHAPPRHIHDAEDRCHRGFECFRKIIDRYEPQYFIHGHIHFNFTAPDERIWEVNQTKVVNSYGHFLFEIAAQETA